jgi:hypothetical protein
VVAGALLEEVLVVDVLVVAGLDDPEEESEDVPVDPLEVLVEVDALESRESVR